MFPYPASRRAFVLATALVVGCSSSTTTPPDSSSGSGGSSGAGGSGSGGGAASSGGSGGSNGGSGGSSGASSGGSSGGATSSGGSGGGSSGGGSGGTASSGGSGSGGPPGDDGGTTDGAPPSGMRYIPPAVLTRKAICYSGYRANENPEASPPTYPSEAEVTQDLKVLVQGGWTLLRLFDCSPHASVTLKAIRDGNFDVKVLQGVWISGAVAKADADNQAEIQRCLALNSMYSDIIVAFSIGNETLDDWSDILTPAADLAGYIQQVRSQVSQPVTTDDFTPVFSLSSDGSYSYAPVAQVVQAIDFIDLHSYPFIDAPYQSWDYQQTAVAAGPQRAVAMMNAAQAYNVANVMSVHQALAPMGIDRPILLSETGWKTVPDANTYEVSLAHPVNQKMYYDTMESWVYGSAKDGNSPLAVFYFEFSDEPWKQGDDNWGLFDTSRYAKYVMWSQFPGMKPAGAPSYTDADAVYYKAGDPTNPPN